MKPTLKTNTIDEILVLVKLILINFENKKTKVIKSTRINRLI